MIPFYRILKKIIFSLMLSCFTLSQVQAQFNGIGGLGGFNARSTQRMIENYRNGRADGKKMRSYLGYDVGLFFSFADRTYEHRYYNIDANGTNTGEYVYTKKLKPRIIGANANSYIPLAKLSRTSCLAFDWGVTAMMMTDGTDRVVLQSGSTYDFSILYIQVAMPLCLEYKYGGEAIYDKSEAFSFTFGAGLFPSLTSAALGNSGKISGAISPMVKAGLGFFAGVEWKITASYIGQSGALYTGRQGDAGLESAPDGSIYTIRSGPSVQIGLSVMPFSFDWDDSRW